jgi:hypothetical protein
MNLSSEDLTELNTLLKSKSLDLPDFRREVGKSGSNYAWLQRNITIRNKELSGSSQSVVEYVNRRPTSLVKGEVGFFHQGV